MHIWIGKGNWKNDFGKMFLDLKDLLSKYEVRLAGLSVRQATMHHIMMLARSSESVLPVYIKEPRRADKIIPSILWRLNARLEDAAEYEMMDVNDFTRNKGRLCLGPKPWLKYGTVQKSIVLCKNKRTDHLPMR
jgi:hypothetical protein